MIRNPLPRRALVILGALSVLVLILGYSWLSYNQHQENPTDTTVPGWGQMYEGLVKLSRVDPRSGERWIVVDALATGERLFLGLGISIVGSILLGVHMGSIPIIEALFLPALSFLAKIVPTAALAVFFVLVGTDLEMFVTMIVFGVLPGLTMSIHLAAKGVPRELIDKAYTLGASHMEVVWTVTFRYILPWIIDAVRLSIGPAMVYLIAAELVVGDVGFGYRIRLLSRRLDMNVVYPYLAFLAGFGFFMDYALVRLQRWLCPWFEESR